MSNFTKSESNDETVLLCKVHYFKRFHEGGSYLGGDKFKVKADRDVRGSSNATPVPTSESNSPVPSSTPTVNETVFALPKAAVEEKKAVAAEVAPVVQPETATVAEAPAVEEPVAETDVVEAEVAVASEETVADAEPVAEAASPEDVDEAAADSSTPDTGDAESDLQDSAEKLTLEEIPASDD
jgi:hypothetical protein